MTIHRTDTIVMRTIFVAPTASLLTTTMYQFAAWNRGRGTYYFLGPMAAAISWIVTRNAHQYQNPPTDHPVLLRPRGRQYQLYAPKVTCIPS